MNHLQQESFANMYLGYVVIVIFTIFVKANSINKNLLFLNYRHKKYTIKGKKIIS